MHNRKKIFREREVEVIFDDEWTVIKLDEHRYYRRISGQGIKGVDFLAVHENFGLVLIEMKNYKYGIESIPEDVDDRMIEKRKGTLRLINIIHHYYQRQIYFRLLTSLGWRCLFPKEWSLWIQAKRHLDAQNFFFLGIIDY
jgi:hypothetical protein